jgi:hypothetical protein
MESEKPIQRFKSCISQVKQFQCILISSGNNKIREIYSQIGKDKYVQFCTFMDIYITYMNSLNPALGKYIGLKLDNSNKLIFDDTVIHTLWEYYAHQMQWVND